MACLSYSSKVISTSASRHRLTKSSTHHVQLRSPPPYSSTPSTQIFLLPQYIARASEPALIIQERMISSFGKVYDIINEAGEVKLKVEIPPMSRKEEMRDVNGKLLFVIRTSALNATRFYFEEEGGKKIFEAKGHTSFSARKFSASFTSPTGTTHELSMKGDKMDDRTVTIKDAATYQIIAQRTGAEGHVRQLLTARRK